MRLFSPLFSPFELKPFSTDNWNWAVDFLNNTAIGTNAELFIGCGYLHNEISFKRIIDQHIINSYDSIPTGYMTNGYVYHMARIPLGYSYNLLNSDRISLSLGIEADLNFNIIQKYRPRAPINKTGRVHLYYFGEQLQVNLGLGTTLKDGSKLRLVQGNEVKGLDAIQNFQSDNF